MADVAISALPATATPASTAVVPLVDAGATKKVTLADLVKAGGSITTADEVTLTKSGQTISVKALGIANAQVSNTAAIAGTKISPNFGSQVVVTTGSYRAGANPSTGGAYNLSNATDIRGMKVDGVTNAILVRIDSSDTVSVGDVAAVGHRMTSGGVHGFRVAGVDVVTMTGTIMTVPVGAVSIGASPAAAGALRMVSASGAYSRNNAGTTDITWIRTNSSDGMFIGEGAASYSIADNKINVGSNIEISVSGFRFDFAVVSPSITQEDDATAAVTGDTLVVQAQSVTGTGATVGGALFQRGGDSTNGVGGALGLRTGIGATAIQAGAFTASIGNTAFFSYPGTVIPAASSGILRAHHNATIVNARNNANSADRNILRWGTVATDTLHVGDTAAAMVLAGTSLQMAVASNVSMFELTTLATNREILALFRGATLTTTQMPANTGDQVLYFGVAATAPTANPVSGYILFADASGFWVRGPSGTVTLLGTA